MYIFTTINVISNEFFSGIMSALTTTTLAPTLALILYFSTFFMH